MILEPLDGVGNNTQINISVQRDREIVTMKIGKPLPPKCLWSALILPYTCEADMQITELSKFNLNLYNTYDYKLNVHNYHHMFETVHNILCTYNAWYFSIIMENSTCHVSTI